ncbi:MAG: hypothetical protein ACLGIO_00765 [Acidimicrobiia bacterium]
MKPYLRPLSPHDAALACPAGAVAEPAGTWGGRRMEVVYDAARHEVAFTRGQPTATVSAVRAATGWRQARSDGLAVMWVRARPAPPRRPAEAGAGPDPCPAA